jgi:hypothetical protein
VDLEVLLWENCASTGSCTFSMHIDHNLTKTYYCSPPNSVYDVQRSCYTIAQEQTSSKFESLTNKFSLLRVYAWFWRSKNMTLEASAHIRVTLYGCSLTA